MQTEFGEYLEVDEYEVGSGKLLVYFIDDNGEQVGLIKNLHYSEVTNIKIFVGKIVFSKFNIGVKDIMTKVVGGIEEVEFVKFEDFGVDVRDLHSIESTFRCSIENNLPIYIGSIGYFVSKMSDLSTGKVDKNLGIKQARYTGKSNEDLIDRWAREHTPEVFRTKVMAQFDRYTCRYGLKDDPLVEAKKLQDYANRLVQYELSIK